MNIPVYDRDTREKLVACHGPERALAIIERRDEATNADIASWRRLCAVGVSKKVGKPGQTVEDFVMSCVARGVPTPNIAELVRGGVARVEQIIEAHA